MKRQILILLAALMLVFLGMACAGAEPLPAADLDDSGVTGAVPSGYRTIADLTQARIGVQTGTTFNEIVAEALPDAKISYFNSYPDMAAALLANKIDAFPGDEPVIRLMTAENDQLAVLDGRLDSFEFGFVLPKTEDGERLMGELNDWLVTMRVSGELDKTTRKWTEGAESEKTVPDYASFPAKNGTLKMATEGAYAPMNYYRGEELVGMEIDLAAQFCEAYGYGLIVEALSFDGILPAVQAGKVDFVAAGVSITEERRESVNFSDPYYTGGTMMAVLKSKMAQTQTVPQGVYTSLDQLEGKHIGVQTGTSFDALVSERLPDAKVEYFNEKADMLNALLGKKIDAFVTDEPVAKDVMRQYGGITYMQDCFDSFDFGAVFPKNEKGEQLQKEFNAFLRQFKADGKLESLEIKWFGDDESQQDMPTVPVGEKGTLRLATSATYKPFEYVLDGQIVGYDIDLMAQFCVSAGYGLEILDMNFDGVLPSVQTGKCDFAAAGIAITAERGESVLFSEPNFSGRTVAVVLMSEFMSDKTEENGGFLSGLRASFEKTFIREDRWRLFVEGIGTTLLITVLAILCGTALGFCVFMLCRNGNPIANGVTRVSMWLVQGTPMVVLLMILYYIIFGSVAISGILVAVIGFSLTFGSSVFGLLKMGVGAVDNGQYEAAYALGYSNRRTFFKVILPQALPHVLSAYKGEIVGLIKATAIVGYIAVQDLTKMGDIVRSRTYEAFFPLIAITVIYFVLEGLLGFLVSRIGVNFNPKHRKAADILKGVNIRHEIRA